MQQEIPLTQKIYDFYRTLHTTLEKMPKKDRYSIGLKLDTNTLDLLELAILAGSTTLPEKYDHLSRASAKLDLLKLLARLLYDLKAIDRKKYLELESHLQEIGKMIGGWLKSLKQ
jgi:hypothetical protein